jgi:hypothetical protein
MPIAGTITFAINADSEKAAIEAAAHLDAEQGEMEWDICNPIVSGHVLYAPLNKANATLLGED